MDPINLKIEVEMVQLIYLVDDKQVIYDVWPEHRHCKRELKYAQKEVDVAEGLTG